MQSEYINLHHVCLDGSESECLGCELKSMQYLDQMIAKKKCAQPPDTFHEGLLSQLFL